MNPMDAAAASRDKLRVGSTQNPGIHAKTAPPVRVITPSTRPPGRLGSAASMIPRAAASIGMQACALRSPVLSEDRAASQSATTAAENGRAGAMSASTGESRVASRKLAGSQKMKEYPATLAIKCAAASNRTLRVSSDRHQAGG